MSVRQYEPYAAQLGYLSENIHRHLTERECGIFDRGLADYHRRRNVKAFVDCLSLVLNTNYKRQLLIPIRDTYIKPSDTGRFNQLVQAHGLATSMKKKRRDNQESGNKFSDGGIHKADVKRDANGEWGFNIRGGSDQGTGVFISWVEPESNAHKNGLQVGDQILKANETSFETINHHDAVQLVCGCKRLRLWLFSHGQVPTARMAHKVYRWVDPDGRPTTPPSDPFTVAEQMARGNFRFGSEADERKVTVMVDSGKELGISIRGGSEHGLGIYISKVDEASVAEAYGLKVGDQILEVNGVSFLNIVHADAARALRAQPCMVIRIKDVGKLPHSRITTYGHTHWHRGQQKESGKGSQPKAFQKGAGTQVMLRKHDTGIQGRGMMNEVARSVLTSHELSTFTYYIHQYEHHGLSVDDLATALLDLLDTAEKLQLIGEVRGIVRASDLDNFNEITIHQEIAAKKAYKKGGLGSISGSQTWMMSRDGSGLMTSQPRNAQQTIAEIHQEDPQALQSRLSPPAAADMSFSSGTNTLTLEEDVDFGGRDQVPQRMSPVTKKAAPGAPVFHAPPPPSSKPSTSTPEVGGRPEAALANGLKERRQRVQPGLSDQSTMDEEDVGWDSAAPSLSTIRSPQMEVVSSVSLPEIEARIQQELEQKMKTEFEEKERRLQEEHLLKLEREKHDKEEQLRMEREAVEQQLAEAERRTAREVEQRVRREAEQEMRQRIEERERAMAEKMERLSAEQKQRQEQESQVGRREREEEEKERLKMELEERIWKEAEESLRLEFESRMQKERKKLQHQSDELKTAALDEAERQLQQQLEKKYQQQYEQKLRAEKQLIREREQEEQRRKEALERQKQREDVERMEAEEQAKIDLEEKIRKETEAAVRAEYEARLQYETEQRAHLADEVKAHRAAEERLEQEREQLERERERERVELQQRQEQQAREQRKKGEGDKRKEQRERKEREERRREESRRQGTSERQRLALERQQREREEEEERRRIQQQEQQEKHGGARSEEDEEVEKLLQIQRQQAWDQQHEEEEEIERQKEQERREREAAMAMKQSEAERKRELQRKREENIRRREEEQRRREDERRRRLEAKKREQEEEEHRKRQEEVKRVRNGKMKSGRTHQVAVKFGDETDVAVKQRQQARDQVIHTHQLVEEDRRRAEEKLQRRMERMMVQQQQQQQQQQNGSHYTDSPSNTPESAAKSGGGKSFGGYTDLEGDIVVVTVTKVCKKLGIAIDGGANTKQKAVIIREISPEGCAGRTAVPSLRLGQQLLQVDDTSLYGLRHKETVMTIKGAFEGPMNKTLTFIVLDPQEGRDETDGEQEPAKPEAAQEPSPEPVPEPPPDPVPEPVPDPQPQVQLRKKRRPAHVEEHMREKGLDEFIAQASSDLPSRRRPAAQQDTGLSFGGYTNLHGEILTIPVTKVNKKLGMAIDGGANTKQQAITIRQITPDGSAALSGDGLKVGQQILQVNSRSLYKLSHGEAVSTIKTAFEGPINKTTVTFIVLDPQYVQ